MAKITVKDAIIRTIKVNDIDYICITDIARQKNPLEPKDVVKNWLRSKNTLEYLGLWEMLNNPDFKGIEFDPLLKEAGSNAFTMSPSRWIETTNAIGIISKNGAKEWRDANPDLKGNIRDYATINQLICLSNLENLNAVFIQKGMEQSERLTELNKIAIQQMKVLEAVEDRKLLK